jgi:Bacterial Ig-like domain (group 2)
MSARRMTGSKHKQGRSKTKEQNMKIAIRFGIVSAFLGLLAVQMPLKADTLTNNFTGSADYVAGGIIGDTNWDGVYLNSGDIYLGTGGGTTTTANETDNMGYLTTQGSVGNWAGAGDSSFFLYKVVQGDFDVSVDLAAPFDNSAYHLPGLLARVYNPNNSGAPYTAATNSPGAALENWIYISRWEEFGGDIHGRFVTNNVDHDGYCSGQPSDSSDITTADRYLRITRVGDTFTLYEKTNQADAWFMIANSVRTFPEWHGLPMMVGVHDETGTGNAPVTYFKDFELTGTNVTFPVMPPAPSAFVTTATNTSGSLTFSWTPGAAGDSSLVVMTQGRRIQHNPVSGIDYNADGAFGDNNALLDGAGEYVVYSGTNSTVTISNLSANIFTYSVAVYEYTNNGVETVYNTAAPITNTVVGPGVITSISLSANSTNIPVNGATSFRVLANFSTGLSNLDQTANALWYSGDPTIASVDSAGAVSGVAVGSTFIVGTLGTLSATNYVTVHGPFAFADNFTSTNNYIADGLVNSMYDGLFLNYGDVPGGRTGGDGAGFSVILNSQITTTNGLYMSSVQSDWQGSADDGPFLFKVVPGANQGVSGDFEALVHINNMNTLNGVVAGIMARLYNPANAGPGPGGRENHVNYWKIQNGATSVRATLNNAATTYAAGAAADGWLLIQRSSSTNFYFYEKAAATDPWTLTASVALPTAAADAPMEVGPAQQSTTGVNGLTTYDAFALDAPGITSATPEPPAATDFVMALNTNDLSMTLNWVAADNSGNPVASIVVMRSGAPVTAVPPVGAALTANSVFGSGTDLGGGNYVVFSSDNPPASTNNTVTVTGLTKGQTYYAVVYTYAGTGNSTVYNPVTGASDQLIDAAITNIYAFVPGGIPVDGIGKVTIYGVDNTGQLISINTAGAVVTADDTNVIKSLQNVLTGVTNGTSGVTVVLGPYTVDINVTVHPPSFTDDFSTDHDYLVDGSTNSTWDGFHLQCHNGEHRWRRHHRGDGKQHHQHYHHLHQHH